jgi:hypothetical protein
MSVTHANARITPAHLSDFAGRHPQLAPFLVAFCIFTVSAAVVLAFTGLPG